MPYLTRPKGHKLWPHQIEIKICKEQQREIKAIQKANQWIVDIKQSQQTMASGSGQQQLDQKPSTSHSMPHIPKEFKNLPFFYEDNGRTMCSIPLNIIQGLKSCPHLQNIRDHCAKQGVEIPNVTTTEPVTTDILTPQQYLEKERQGLIPCMANHEVMQYIAENLKHTTTQVISLKFDDFTVTHSHKPSQ